MDPKVTLQTLIAWAPTPAKRPELGVGQSPSVGLPSLRTLGHQSGKGTGTPFPASTAAAPASFASEPPNYS